MSLFQGLSLLRGQLEAVRLTLRFVGDNQINVIVSPEVTPEVAKVNPALANEFSVIATAEELDAGFVSQFATPVAQSRKSLLDQANEQIEAQKQEAAKKAEKAAVKSAKTLPTKSTTPASSTPKLSGSAAPSLNPDEDSEDDEVEAGDEAGDEAAPAPSKPATTALDLFGGM